MSYYYFVFVVLSIYKILLESRNLSWISDVECRAKFKENLNMG